MLALFDGLCAALLLDLLLCYCRLEDPSDLGGRGGTRDLNRMKAGIPEADVDAWLDRDFGTLPDGVETGNLILSAKKLQADTNILLPLATKRIGQRDDYREDGRLAYQVVHLSRYGAVAQLSALILPLRRRLRIGFAGGAAPRRARDISLVASRPAA